MTKVDAILGADDYGRLLQDGLRPGTSETPSAQSTLLGWVLMGCVADQGHNISSSATPCRPL